MKHLVTLCLCAVALAASGHSASAAEQYSGIYPHLAMFNNEGECGTGAVVPWAGRLWVVTYAPHKPTGSSDKLYEINESLEQTVRPESIGGTPANRMIHAESQQLFIGPYAIDAGRNVRTIPYTIMYGRHTGNARHLTDPAHKIYYATMEEGIYEVDVKSLAVKELWADEQRKEGRHADLPGYHGKGFYSGQGRMVYANNGEHGGAALRNPTIASGVLAQWNGQADSWTVVRRNQFTEVTGPGGIEGSSNPATDPIWCVGWDFRSLILMVLHEGEWHTYRLPKASHAYDGAHGWNTEWPRIRDIGEDHLLMTMHGMFWRFPKNFAPGNTGGIAPRSSYMKVVGDFCRWNDKVILGCDDTAASEFLNKTVVKGEVGGPGQSQSNLVFLDPAQLDHFGPTLGRGSVWLHDPVKAGQPSDPFLIGGFAHSGVHLRHEDKQEATFTLETDSGDGNWKQARTVKVPSGETVWVSLTDESKAAWVRITSAEDLTSATAAFYCTGKEERTSEATATFKSIASLEATEYAAGLLRARGKNLRTLAVGATRVSGGKVTSEGFYELTADMKLNKLDDPHGIAWLQESVAVPTGVVQRDAASVLIVDDRGRRWRLPQNKAYATPGAVPLRVAREVVTERNLLNLDGTFYELPAENAGGFAGLRPVATHNRRITDYASYRGLMVMTGIGPAAGDDPHIIRSADGLAAVWAGSIDDLWSFGKPVGTGGPWLETPVKQGIASDAYLMTGYQHKTLTLAHNASGPVRMRVEVDLAGDGQWALYQSFEVAPGHSFSHKFPAGYGAYWLRTVCEADCTATAQLVYE